jgi:hypothetical protein
VNGTDDVVERILTSYETITVVGASRAAYKAAQSVPASRASPARPACGGVHAAGVSFR